MKIMKFDIMRKTDIYNNGEVKSVQVHYQLRNEAGTSMHNGFVTLEHVDNESHEELKQRAIKQLKNDMNELDAE